MDLLAKGSQKTGIFYSVSSRLLIVLSIKPIYFIQEKILYYAGYLYPFFKFSMKHISEFDDTNTQFCDSITSV